MASSVTSIQSALSAGEWAPSLLGRVDLKNYTHATSTCRNFFANYKGGVTSRGGLAYVGTCKQPGTAYPPRDIPFQFSLTQGFVLEFGDNYMRVKSEGAYVLESSKVISSVSSTAVFTTSGSHGYSVGDWVYDEGNEGFSGLTWIINSVPTSSTFTVTDLFGNVITSAVASGSGTIARLFTLSTPYLAVDLPYLKYTQSADVMTLTCVNTGTQTEYPPYDLTRLSNNNWVLTEQTFSASIQAPQNLIGKVYSSTTTTTYYSYVVTAIDAQTGEESIASNSTTVYNNDISLYAGSNSLTWDAVPGASSYNIYAAIPSYSNIVPASSLFGFIGTALGPSFTDTNITADFTIVPPVHNDPFARGAILDVVPTAGGINYSQQTIGYTVNTSTGTGFDGTPVASNGEFVGFIIKNKGHGYDPSDTITITDSGGGVATGFIGSATNPVDGDKWTFNKQEITFRTTAHDPFDLHIEATLALTMQALANFLNAQTYVSLSVAYYTSTATSVVVTYKTPGAVGNTYTLSGGTPSGPNLTGGGTVGSGASANLTVGPETGTYPGVCGYFQQRRVYAASLNQPDTYWMSQPGLFNNMDSSIPVTDSDSITGTPWAQQVNGIQSLVPMPGGLIVLTGKGAWQINGGQSAAITPSNQTAIAQAYNGCTDTVPPITINEDILYVQSKGYMVRDLAYNFYINIYTGADLTVLSNHLFTDYQIVQWAWAEEPYKLIWLVRNDGKVLCLTYLKEQEVYAWTRHDTNGLFQGVCVVTEPPVDATYFIVKRYVQGAWRYYSERMDNRIWSNAEDTFCVDSGLSYPVSEPNATLTVSAATGTVTLSASSGVFSSGNVGDVIRIGGGKATVTSFTNSTTVLGLVTEAITDLVTDDPESMPVPAEPGSWSISTPTTTVAGLNHLEGLEVAIVADGSVVPNKTVTGGQITLDYPASVITVGLPFICQVQTMYIDVDTGRGTIQNKRKNISSVGVRVEGTRGLTIGADQPDSSFLQNNAAPPWTDMQELKERTQAVYPGVAIPLYTGDYYKNITSGWAVQGQIALQQSYPLPASILSLVAYWTPGDD